MGSIYLDKQNSIESRVVVLRDFDAENLLLNFHTDFRSPKVEDLKQNNNSPIVINPTQCRGIIIKTTK